MTMLFPELLSDDHRRFHAEVCNQFSVLCDDCVVCLRESVEIAGPATVKTGEVHHCTVILLARHVIEFPRRGRHLDRGGCEPALPSFASQFARSNPRYQVHTRRQHAPLRVGLPGGAHPPQDQAVQASGPDDEGGRGTADLSRRRQRDGGIPQGSRCQLREEDSEYGVDACER